MNLELVPVPVSDVDRARAFYVEKVGFNVDLDHQVTDEVRIVQLTPPGSETCQRHPVAATTVPAMRS